MAVAYQCLWCAPTEPFLTARARQSLTLPFQRKHFFSSLPLSSRSRNLCSSFVAASSKKKNKKKLPRDHVTDGDEEEEEEEEDALELLFKQLEEDLKRGGDLSDDDDEDEITEEEMALLERELEDALGDFDAELLNSDLKDSETDSDPENDDDDDDDDDGDGRSTELRDWRLKKMARALREDIADLENALGGLDADLLNSNVIDVETGSDPENDDGGGGGVAVAAASASAGGDEGSLKLRNWQMKKLARALKTGRRKTSIKNLAADLCLDRALVLQLLRNPPPDLLMMSLSIPDEPKMTVVSLETMPSEIVHKEACIDHAEPGPKAKVPVHTLQRNWLAQKRLKKAHVDTLERVYRRSKRPTNAMISSIVHVTNIPRKKVVKWFEDKRAEEGVPDRRLPYERSVPDAA